ncbi:SGNH/GDSL hydrolase family protein [Kitasatospora saccharophila]|uniref:SGNH/GDSL hydrolase family protein n=1 Tax=Kitasatospora saccharophila TaxID=407973 RepID=UPI0036433782
MATLRRDGRQLRGGRRRPLRRLRGRLLARAGRHRAARRRARPRLPQHRRGRAAHPRGPRDPLERVLEFRPDLVNVAAGGNDLFSPSPDLDAAEENLEAVYAALTGQGAHVFAFTVCDVFEAFPEFAELRLLVSRLNDRIRAVAARHGATLVEMWDHPVRTSPTLMSADGMHFSMEGHAVLAGEIIRALAESRQPVTAGRPA